MAGNGSGGLRVLFSGGSGKAGRHVVPHLMERGHLVLDADLVPLDQPGVRNLTVDVTDPGQVFGASTSHTDFDELEPGGPPRPFDAVVHFAAVPRILLRPDAETLRVNALGTYAVVEAAAKLGVRKIVVASSETTYGVCFAEGRADPLYLPVDEEHPTEPTDAYALSKVVNEATARAFQKRTGADVYALRIGNVIEPHEYDRFAGFNANPEVRRRNLFNYVDARDLGQIVDRCLRTDGLGYRVFNAANDGNSVDLPAPEIAQRFFPGVPLRHPLEPREGLYSNIKAREMLGFQETHPWPGATGGGGGAHPEVGPAQSASPPPAAAPAGARGFHERGTRSHRTSAASSSRCGWRAWAGSGRSCVTIDPPSARPSTDQLRETAPEPPRLARSGRGRGVR